MSKRYFYTALIAIVAITMTSYVVIRANKHASLSERASAVTATTSIVGSPDVEPSERFRSPTKKAASTSADAEGSARSEAAPGSSASAETPNVTFIAAGKSYAAFAPAGSTVLDVMRILASTTDFTFGGKEYPGLGFFVESVGGKKAGSGYSWILYVNVKLSGTGASQTTLRTGDTVEWRYEKNY